jgi:hypothetical protein
MSANGPAIFGAVGKHPALKKRSSSHVNSENRHQM